MAIRCSNCGNELPKEDARFCGVCGTLVASHPFSPQSLATSQQKFFQPSGTSAPVESERPQGLREQIAQQPPARATRPRHDEPPSWMSKLEEGPMRPERTVSQTPQPPQLREPEQEHESVKPQDNASMQGRELKVKVWDGQAETIEELPTRPLAVHTPEPAKALMSKTPSPSMEKQPSFAPEQVEYLDTIPLSTYAKQPQAQLPPSMQQRTNPVSQPTVAASMPTAQEQQRVPSARRKSRTPLVAPLVVLVLLVLGSLGAWVVIAQPFSVSSITQPQQSFQDTTLGIALAYPTGWTAKEDHAKNTLHLADSSQTAQVTIVVAPANASDMAQFLKQKASSLGITGAKTAATLTFASASWQQIQGNIQENGASYTATVLATTHNNRVVTIMQLAPQSAYTDEEAIVFAPLRASFQFV